MFVCRDSREGKGKCLNREKERDTLASSVCGRRKHERKEREPERERDEVRDGESACESTRAR